MDRYTPDKRRQYTNSYRTCRKQYALDKLGGKCAECGTKRQLNFDHIDPKTKVAPISKLWTAAKDKLDTELAKCQLLCQRCHNTKTSKEVKIVGRIPYNKGKWSHGSSGYVYHRCRCNICLQWNKERNKRRRRGWVAEWPIASACRAES